MPHQCTTCGRSFEDGSKEMLSGCPDCGGNKFQFKPAGAADGNVGEAGGSARSAATARKKTPENVGPAVGDAPETGGDDRSSAVNRAAATVRDWVGARDETEADSASAADSQNSTSVSDDPTPVAEDSASVAEDSAQASARRDVVPESELPDEPPEDASSAPTADSDAEANVVEAPDVENPGLKELREELNSQFESIRIVAPGQYELNLMELYEREEYIISLKEDGKYVIEVPDAWDATER
ncbi:OapC/ArvC family zinc-ribbon domain-containing protein [Halorussus salinisoli]|uniref:OapC/ArvC family zinc-ribbon domain-containing protein n=1 Tax=Halorussus salinisoli TaxID=2558242 RepID=UPI0010C1F8D8|nr:Zn-ribbon containing protein [Halorussus salinisoli]